MMHAYNELYLDDAMDNLGEMFSYAVDLLGYEADVFFLWFIQCGLADEFGQGHPRYVAGMSGEELAAEVIYQTTGTRIGIELIVQEDKSSAYWTGWSLGYYQWYSGKSFKELYRGGLTAEKVQSLYLLHEADLTKFVEEADEILRKNAGGKPSALQKIRKARGMTQKELSDVSGVKLRMIQLYEQKKNDINKTAVETVRNLAAVLGCRIDDLME